MALLSEQQKPYLLDLDILVDTPVPIFKSLVQIIGENFWLIFTFLLMIVAGILLYFFTKKNEQVNKSVQEPPPVDPYADALEQLSKLKSASPKLSPKPFIFRLSEILRLYVQRQFNLPALERTGEEFIREISIHPFLKQKFENSLTAFVKKGDQIKYSPAKFHSKQLDELLLSAEQFITLAQSELDAQTQKFQADHSST